MAKISTPIKAKQQTPRDSMAINIKEAKQGPSATVISFLKNFARNYRPAFESSHGNNSDLSRLLPGYCLS